MDFADGENLLEANAQQNAFAYLKGSNLYVRTFDVTSNALTKKEISRFPALKGRKPRNCLWTECSPR